MHTYSSYALGICGWSCGALRGDFVVNVPPDAHPQLMPPCVPQAHWYLTQLLMDSLKQAAPEARVVFTTSPSESKTEDIDWDNLE